jgi:tRNA dimethylallyltransferase
VRIILLGPTAVGKTALSLSLAQLFDAPIISVDSRQCYQYLNIGTAKPNFKELCQAPHFNISILNPNESDSVAKFYNRVQQWEMEFRTARSTHQLYVGGSTLHLQSLIKPLDDIPASNEDNLNQLREEIESSGIASLYQRLKKVDPDYAERMDGYNTQRIMRALDVYMQTGQPFSSFHTNWQEFTLPADTIVFGLKRPRKKLYERINRRVHNMIAQGLVKETQAILDRGFSPSLQSLNTVGYKQIIAYLNGNLSLEKAIKRIQAKTRQYAKRQLTWFRRWPFIHWLDRQNCTDAALINEIQNHVAAHSNNH